MTQGPSEGPPPAGWYPDPLAKAERRWWDGIQWTAHTDGADLSPLARPASSLPQSPPAATEQLNQEPEWVTRNRNPDARLSGRAWALIVAIPMGTLLAVGLGSNLVTSDTPGTDIADAVVGIIMLAGGVLLYFLPTFIAVHRKVRQQSAVVVINVLAGWTFIGWVVALAMAFAAVDNSGAPQR